MKRFRFLLALLATLAPSGSWAAAIWPGECTITIFAGSHVTGYNGELIVCDYSVNSTNGAITAVNCSGRQAVTGAEFYNLNYNYGGLRTFFWANGQWYLAGSLTEANRIRSLQGAIDMGNTPLGTLPAGCGPPLDPTDPPKNLGPPCSSN